MPSRGTLVGIAGLIGLGLGFALVPRPASGQTIHRHGFAGKQTVLQRGDANVRAQEKEHDISKLSFKSQPSSEHIQITTEAGTGDTAFVNYQYDTPPAPVSPVLSASVWIKATRPGTQLRARVVFPKEPDPARPESALTMLIIGGSYTKVRTWEKLSLEDVPALVGKHLPALQTKTGRNVNTADAYVDRLVLNVYSGGGTVDVWVDDLDIGPVKAEAKADQAGGVPAKGTKAGEAPIARTRLVQQRGGQLLVDGKPYFFRAIRYTGTPLHVLREAGFDTLWLQNDAAPELIDQAGREGWFVIPSAPKHEFALASAHSDVGPFDLFRQKFANSDVLFWDLGGGLTEETQDRVYKTAADLRRGDKTRPIGGDLWDGFTPYSQSLDIVGAHRWPLFTSLGLPEYRDWLEQRRLLTGGRPIFWAWVQNHLPEWYAANIASRPVQKGVNPELAFTDPVGPHPEQVRQLAYLSIAAGARGLGFWSDRYLADAYQGRDRLQGMALLNTELDLISPVLLSAGSIGERTVWLDTNNPNVKAALIVGQKNTLLLPMWLGSGDQYVPPQGAVTGLKIVVPTIPEGHDPWLITPAGPECLQRRATRTPKGTELILDEFDMVAPIVFTDDQGPNGIVVWWQDQARRYGRLAALWSLDLAAVVYEKVRLVHLKLAEQGVTIRDAIHLFEQTQHFYREAEKHFANEQYDKAYRDATRALRPMRIVMRDHWRLATETLDVPTASPFAVSFFSLPQHWELAKEVRTCQPGASVLWRGNFEVVNILPAEGIPIDKVPGWSARKGSLQVDRVVVAAGLVSSEKLEDKPNPRTHLKEPKTLFSSSRPVTPADEGYVDPAPELGRAVLKLEARSQPIRDGAGKAIPASPILERTFLAVDSPAVKLPPGTLVRISAWMKVPAPIQGDAAGGALFYDDAGGEPLCVRALKTGSGPGPGTWKEYHLYRRVPASGQISVTMALTGVGVVYFDDVRIEPMIAGAASAKLPAAGPRTPVLPATYTSDGRRLWETQSRSRE
jgi:hypothetical protein